MAVYRKIAQPEASPSCVRCPTCSCEIPVLNARRLPREFSVLCPNCGRREEHQLAGLHGAKREEESIHELRNSQFGKRNGEKSENILIQPKTRLNELTSWLLQ
jgi:hypothetical protein